MESEFITLNCGLHAVFRFNRKELIIKMFTLYLFFVVCFYLCDATVKLLPAFLLAIKKRLYT